jgi:single-stranded DNA-binding protein
MKNNTVRLIGAVKTKPVYSHTTKDKDYYIFELSVLRKSGIEDVIPVIFSPFADLKDRLTKATLLEVKGDYRSYNLRAPEGTKLLLNVYAKEITFIKPTGTNENEIYLNGYICKQPTYRKTPKGRRLCDVILAVNRDNGKSDYIPCIVWGNNAEICKNLKIGANVELKGRIQSRIYKKELDWAPVERTAYEVSVIWQR